MFSQMHLIKEFNHGIKANERNFALKVILHTVMKIGIPILQYVYSNISAITETVFILFMTIWYLQSSHLCKLLSQKHKCNALLFYDLDKFTTVIKIFIKI